MFGISLVDDKKGVKGGIEIWCDMTFVGMQHEYTPDA